VEDDGELGYAGRGLTLLARRDLYLRAVFFLITPFCTERSIILKVAGNSGFASAPLPVAIAAGKGADAKPLLPATFSIIDQSVQKGVIKKNTARRYKSRLAKRVNGLPA